VTNSSLLALRFRGQRSQGRAISYITDITPDHTAQLNFIPVDYVPNPTLSAWPTMRDRKSRLLYEALLAANVEIWQGSDQHA
jgi:hypothetical protein